MLERISDVLSVPLAAVVDRGQTKLIYRVDGGQLEPVEVELGQRNASAVIVDKGLREGDLITLTTPQ